MTLIETFSTALKALKLNPGRSLLTILGVIIGVFSVVMMISLGQGVQNYITDEFDALGSNLLFVSPGSGDFADDPAKLFSKNKLDDKHIDLINLYASENISANFPYYLVGETVSYKTKSYYSEVVGINYQGLEVLNYSLTKGTGFSRAQEKANAKVAIIGPLIVEELFSNQSPIGSRVKIGNDNYTVIGVFKEKGSNYDDQIIIPFTSAKESFELGNYSSIVVKVKSPELVESTLREVELALLRDLKEDQFSVLSQQDILSSIQEILSILTLALGLIAGISLLVGGIGIMNIMLVSVTERIREIGLRKALGATGRVIAFQFLMESVILSVSGGFIGLLLGWLGSKVAQNFIRAEIPYYAVILAFGFSALVGVVFGTYPAINASKKDPIEALRYE